MRAWDLSKRLYFRRLFFRKIRKQVQKDAGIVFAHDSYFADAVPIGSPGGGPFVIYDCVDLPRLRDRTSAWMRSRPVLVKTYTDSRSRQLAKNADMITLTSPSYAPVLREWLAGRTPPMHSLVNFLSGVPKIDLRQISPLRTELDRLHPEIKRWMVLHNRIGKFSALDVCLESLAASSGDWGLCLLGPIDQPDSDFGASGRGLVESLAAIHCPDRVVHVAEPQWGTEKLETLKDFDLGLVPLFGDGLNLRNCLPNRSLELAGLGVVQVTSANDAVRGLSKEADPVLFNITDDLKPETFIRQVVDVTKNPIQKVQPLGRSWEAEFDDFYQALSIQRQATGLDDVLIMSQSSSDRNTRIARLSASFKNRGHHVRIMTININDCTTETISL